MLRQSVRASLALATLVPGFVRAEESKRAFPLQPVQTDPIGAGYPGGNPWDIIGLKTGMDSKSAREAINASTDRLKEKYVEESAFRYSDEKFPVFIRADSMVSDYDQNALHSVIAVFSSAVSGNQVTLIRRSIDYKNNPPANFEQTLAALKSKYGEWTKFDDFGEAIAISFLLHDGELKKDGDGVVRACQKVFDEVHNQNVLETRWFFSSMAQAAAQDNEGNRCSIALYVTMRFAREDGITNRKAVRELNFTLFDVDRYLKAEVADAAEMERLKTLATGAATDGGGAPKL